jgi:FkbM family methyltransferase
MRLTPQQKLAALAGGLNYRSDIRRMLVRRYWQRQDEWAMDFHGIRARFSTADFYSNYWFYGPKNLKEAHEPGVTRLLIERARRSSLFFDIGSNIGYFSVMARLANPGLEVLAVEMDRYLGPLIEKNLAMNGAGPIDLHLGAVSDRRDPIAYTPHFYSFLRRMAAEAAEVPPLQVEAPALRIDELVTRAGRAPDLVKMDVDGAEAGALRAAEPMLANPDLVMFLEVHPVLLGKLGASIGEVGAILARHGLSAWEIPEYRSGEKPTFRRLEAFEAVTGNPMLLVARKDPATLFG